VGRYAANGTGQTEILRGRRCAGGDTITEKSRREIGLLRFQAIADGGQCRCAVARQGAINRLVAQVADWASRFGRVGVVMPDASERHRKHQQRQQRYRNHHVPNWLTRIGHGIGNDTTR
jgi:hypothetical protein